MDIQKLIQDEAENTDEDSQMKVTFWTLLGFCALTVAVLLGLMDDPEDKTPRCGNC